MSSSSSSGAATVAPELLRPFASLSRLHRQVQLVQSAAASSTTYPSEAELLSFQQQLVALESEHKKQNVWGGEVEKGQIPAGQAVMNELVDETHDAIDAIKEKLGALTDATAAATAATTKADTETGDRELSADLLLAYHHLHSLHRQIHQAHSAAFPAAATSSRGASSKKKEAASASAAAPSLPSAAALQSLQEKLNGLESQYKKDNIWCGKLETNHIPSGQAIMNELVGEAHDWIDEIKEKVEQ